MIHLTQIVRSIRTNRRHIKPQRFEILGSNGTKPCLLLHINGTAEPTAHKGNINTQTTSKIYE